MLTSRGLSEAGRTITSQPCHMTLCICEDERGGEVIFLCLTSGKLPPAWRMIETQEKPTHLSSVERVNITR